MNSKGEDSPNRAQKACTYPLPAHSCSWVNTRCLPQGPCDKPELPQIPAPSSGAPPQGPHWTCFRKKQTRGLQTRGQRCGQQARPRSSPLLPASWRAGAWPAAHTGRQYLLPGQACLSLLTPVPWQKLSDLALAGVKDQRCPGPGQPLEARPPVLQAAPLARPREHCTPASGLSVSLPTPDPPSTPTPPGPPTASLQHVPHGQCLTLSQ